MRPGVGVGVFVRKDGTLLMQQRKNAHGHGTWSIPGGHMEYGETPQQAAIREVKEEMNVDIINPRVLGVTNDFMPAEGKHYITIFIEADYAGGEIRIGEPDSVAAVTWQPADKMPENLFIPLKNFLENNRII
jgi:8-oxo-dGTP diphosphatase